MMLMMNLVMSETTWSHPHDVPLPHLDLLDSLDHVEGEGDGAGNAARHGPADEVDHEAVLLDTEAVEVVLVSDPHVSSEVVPASFVQRPVQGREGNITQQSCRVAVPE